MKKQGWALVAVLAVWAPLSAAGVDKEAGFEIGNGSAIDRSAPGWLSMDELGACIPDYEGKITEVFAPPSDGGTPRTRLRVDVYWLGVTMEEAMRQFDPIKKGWLEFATDQIRGIHKEFPISKNWSRFEIQLFRDDRKLQIRLEGNPNKSRAYSKLATSLLQEVKDLQAPVN